MSGSATAHPTLVGWLLRDVILTAAIIGSLWGLHLWHSGSGSLLAAVPAAVLGFIGAYVLCYVFHEWGHLIGARLSGAHMPLLPYRGALIGLFDPRTQSRKQFLWLSWGGVIGYLLVAMSTLLVHFSGSLGLAGAGFAVGGLAFVVQSLSVDLPQIFKVMGGADMAETNRAGAHPRVILKRTWQSWSLLTVALIAWNMTG